MQQAMHLSCAGCINVASKFHLHLYMINVSLGDFIPCQNQGGEQFSGSQHIPCAAVLQLICAIMLLEGHKIVPAFEMRAECTPLEKRRARHVSSLRAHHEQNSWGTTETQS
jgi:hypothetical protein